MGFAELFRQTIRDAVPCVLFDYGNPGDFLKLWSVEDGYPTLLNETNGQNAVIIAWDGRASENDPKANLLAKHLTPLDWALAFSIKVLEKPEITAKAAFHIYIVDLTGKSHDEWAMRMRHQLLAEMPWVTLYAPLILEKDGETATHRKGYQPVLKDDGPPKKDGLLGKNIDGTWTLRLGKPLAESHSQGHGKALSELARQWTATLIQTHDHHDLNNVVGPWIITGVPSDGSAPSLMGLRTKLEWTGLLGIDDGKKGGGEGDDRDVPFQGIGPLDVLAIDDEMGNGWHRVLHSLLRLEGEASQVSSKIGLIGGKGDVCLFGCTDPDALLGRLGISGDAASANVNTELYLSRTFDSPIRDDKELQLRPWLLVLDLRLFSGEDRAEQEWFKKLAAAARVIAETVKESKNKLAWPDFSERELNDLDYDTALSLFPRLCALRWPAVPIVVFSGTGRRKLIAKLADYGNIFLASPKPNVLAGDAREQIDVFIGGLHKEFKSAETIIEAQKKLIRLSEHPSFAVNNGVNAERHCHAVIAFDETGDFVSNARSSVGGVILFAYDKDEGNALNRAVSFQEELHKKFCFYDKAPFYSDAGRPGVKPVGQLLDKGYSLQSFMPVIMAPFSQNVCLSAFQYAIPRKGYSHPETYNDGSYLRAVSRCLELIFFELIPSSMGANQAFTYSVWLPAKQTDYMARLVSHKEVTTAREQSTAGLAYGARREAASAAEAALKAPHLDKAIQLAKNEARRFDYRHTIPTLSLVETIGGPGAAYTIVLQSLSRRKNYEKIIAAMKSLKARKIPYLKLNSPHLNNIENCADFSVLAHLADAIIPAGSKILDGAEFGEGTLTPSLSFDVFEEEKLSDFLHTCELMDDERYGDGFKLAYRHEFFEGNLNEGEFVKASLQRRLRGELRKHMKSISGNDLIELAGLPIRGVGSAQVNSVKNKDASGRAEKSQKKSYMPSPIPERKASSGARAHAGETKDIKGIIKDVYPNEKFGIVETDNGTTYRFDFEGVKKVYHTQQNKGRAVTFSLSNFIIGEPKAIGLKLQESDAAQPPVTVVNTGSLPPSTSLGSAISPVANAHTDGTSAHEGIVKWFNPTKGFGFIQPSNGGTDVFVHLNAVQLAGLINLSEGQKVSYELVTERGKIAAVNLKIQNDSVIGNEADSLENGLEPALRKSVCEEGVSTITPSPNEHEEIKVNAILVGTIEDLSGERYRVAVSSSLPGFAKTKNVPRDVILAIGQKVRVQVIGIGRSPKGGAFYALKVLSTITERTLSAISIIPEGE